MRSSKLCILALLGWLWPTLALAQLITPASMRDANLTTTSTQNLVTTLNTFSAQRTLTIPGSGALSAYYFQFVDTANAINGANTLRIVAADGALINGGSSLTISTAGAYVFIISSPSGYAATIVPPTASGGGGTPGGTSGQVQYNNAGSFGGFTTSGDLTINTATGAGTFTTVNANVGAFGSNVNCTTYTVNAKGLITAASQTACTPAIGSITGLGTGIATALAVNVGSAGAPVLFNGAGGTPSSLVGTNITGTAAGLIAGTASAVAVGGITGAGAGCITWLTTPSSANLRGCISDESGTGLAYFQGGDLGTPSAGVATNLTALNASNLSSGTVAAARGGAGTITGALKGSGAGVVTQAACADLSNGTATCSATTGQLPATATNNNATAGNVGEYIESVIPNGSAVALTTNVAATVTSISLTAGDWDVTAMGYIAPAATTSMTQTITSISGTTNTLDATPGKVNGYTFAPIVTAGAAASQSIPPYRLSLAGTTTVFLVAQATFTISTAGAYGIIRARRIR